MKTLGIAIVLLAAGTGCGDDGDGSSGPLDAGISDAPAVDAEPPIDADLTPDASVIPLTLEDTGLYSDFGNRIIADDVLEYTPAYPLWSDGAVKRRWVHLPAGLTIDTSDMDFWSYPEGTKLWKEFMVGDMRIETRFFWKMGPSPSDWYYVSYGWNADQTEAVELPDGADNVLGTEFDIPEQRDCRKCHQRQPDFALGFTAVQLAHTGAGVTLDTLIADVRLSVNPSGDSPYFPVPGTGNEQSVLGYLHGNCGGCHHRLSDVMDTTALNLRFEVDSMDTVQTSSVYTTIVGVNNLLSLPGVSALIEAGNRDASAIYVRMNERGTTNQMPPRGSELIDMDAVAALGLWIDDLVP